MRSAPQRAVAGANDGWGDDWGNDAPAKPTMPPPAMPAATIVPTGPAPSTHFGGASGATPTKKKVAAAKVKDDSWDDWGDDKW